MKNDKYNCLVDYIRHVPNERLFLTLPEKNYTFGDVLELSNKFRADYPQLVNKSCAVLSNERDTLALFLPAINDICSSLFLQPHDIKNSDNSFYESLGIEFVIYLSDRKVSSITTIGNHKKEKTRLVKNFLLSTSGTTGFPKFVSYTLNSLVSTTQKDIKRGNDFVWGLTYDINRFAGLQVYLQAIVSGSTLVIPSVSANIDSLVQIFAKESVNALSATPSFWRKVLMVPFHKNIPLERITLGGEISNQTLLSALTNSYPAAKIAHIYASTEAGVGFVVKDKYEGFPLEFLDENSSLPCQIKIKSGLLWIKNSQTASKLIKGDIDTDDDFFVNTGDLVTIKGNRVLFLGRDNGSINVGGNKVMPEKVESILEQHPFIVMAKVYAKSSPVLGSLVVSEVELNEDGQKLTSKDLKLELLTFCKGLLEPFETPTLFRSVNSIEINATGKKVRNNK